jgi:hypothetical protein
MHSHNAISVSVIAGIILRILTVWRLLLPTPRYTHLHSGNRQKVYRLEVHEQCGQEGGGRGGRIVVEMWKEITEPERGRVVCMGAPWW